MLAKLNIIKSDYGIDMLFNDSVKITEVVET